MPHLGRGDMDCQAQLLQHFAVSPQRAQSYAAVRKPRNCCIHAANVSCQVTERGVDAGT
jgi:hypothetical protein